MHRVKFVQHVHSETDGVDGDTLWEPWVVEQRAALNGVSLIRVLRSDDAH